MKWFVNWQGWWASSWMVVCGGESGDLPHQWGLIEKMRLSDVKNGMAVVWFNNIRARIHSLSINIRKQSSDGGGEVVKAEKKKIAAITELLLHLIFYVTFSVVHTSIFGHIEISAPSGTAFCCSGKKGDFLFLTNGGRVTPLNLCCSLVWRGRWNFCPSPRISSTIVFCFPLYNLALRPLWYLSVVQFFFLQPFLFLSRLLWYSFCFFISLEMKRKSLEQLY